MFAAASDGRAARMEPAGERSGRHPARMRGRRCERPGRGRLGRRHRSPPVARELKHRSLRRSLLRCCSFQLGGVEPPHVRLAEKPYLL